MNSDSQLGGSRKLEFGIESIIFASRWIQAPLFLGLVAASVLYAIRFMMELVRLVPVLYKAQTPEPLLLGVLTLVDMTMVANLVAMIVIGGYTLFVSKLNIGHSEDRPEWLDKTTAATLKIKLASALVGVSGIHLLKTFIELGGDVDMHLLHGASEHGEHGATLASHADDNMRIMWQVIIHVVFLVSALILSWSERILHPHNHHHESH